MISCTFVFAAMIVFGDAARVAKILRLEPVSRMPRKSALKSGQKAHEHEVNVGRFSVVIFFRP